MCLVGVALLVLLGCCLVCFLLLFESAWWNRGIAEEVTMASYGKAVTGTAVMARSANEEKKKVDYKETKLFGHSFHQQCKIQEHHNEHTVRHNVMHGVLQQGLSFSHKT